MTTATLEREIDTLSPVDLRRISEYVTSKLRETEDDPYPDDPLNFGAPNAETLAAFREAEHPENLKSYTGMSIPQPPKITANFAKTSSITALGTLSNFCAFLEAISKARGWSHRIIPLVFVPQPSKDTANPIVRTKRPPLVIGNTTGVCVTQLNEDGETIKTGRFPCCSCPDAGSKETK